MKKLRFYAPIVCFTLLALPSRGQVYNIADEETLTTCTGTIFDSGGQNGDYANGEDYTMTICADDPNACLQLDFVLFDIEQGFDDLLVFAGPDNSTPPFIELTGDIDPGVVSPGSNCVTLNFQTDGSVTNPGFEIAITCVCPTCDDGILNGEEVGVDCGGPDCPDCVFDIISDEETVSTCSSTLMDSGAFGNYGQGEDFTFTYCSNDPDSCLLIDFSVFALAFGDFLEIHDGNDINGGLIGSFTAGDLPTQLVSASDCITFHFTSGAFSATAQGFELQISCTDACPSCTDGIQNGLEIGVDCGGPDCPSCGFNFISEEGTLTSCDGLLYDSGGANGDYQNNEDYTMTICGDNADDCIQLDFLFFDIEQGFDDLFIYAGPDDTSPLAASLTGDIDPGVISPGTNCVTLNFQTDGSVTNPGFEIAISCACPSCDDGILNGQEVDVDCGGPDCPDCSFDVISEGGTNTTCGATLLDSGGPQNYQQGEDYSITYCSNDPDSCLQIDFALFQLAFGDQLIMYDGTDTTGAVLGVYENGDPTPPLVSASECITIQFISGDFSATAQGFQLDLTCTDACPSCADGIQNGLEIDVDCGGPDCPDCPFNLISEEGTLTTCDGLLYDSGGADGDYDNGEDYTMTICGDDPDACVQLEFLSFNIEQGFDDLFIFAGPDDTFPLVASLTGNIDPGIISPGSNCVTLNFDTDGSVTAPGFEIMITCACPTCDDGILNGEEIGIDCGGPDCPECDFDVISEGGTVTTCDAQLFDTGVFGNYGQGENHVMTYCSDSPDECIQLDFSELELAFGDVLNIYDGTDITGFAIANLGQASAIPETIVGPTGCVTFEFISGDFSATAQGFEVNISCTTECPTCADGILNGYEIGVDCGGPDCPECDFIVMSEEDTYFTCDGVIFDSGINENYENNENYTLTVCATDTTDCLTLDFSLFDIENGFDNLFIFEGTDLNGPQIAALTGLIDPPPMVSTFSSCMTLNFQTDGSVTDIGFQGQFSCGECPEASEQDCIGAIPICDLFYEQTNAYSGSGNVPNEIDGLSSCLDGELNSVWYTFTVQETGILNFVIDPINDNDDYDWALYNITNATCEDLFTDQSLLVSCNSYGVLGINGPTGISTAMGGVGNNNGPGDANGPIFNEDITVSAGETFVLLVEDWSGTPTGYTLDFGESTAGFFYPGGPDLEVAPANCLTLDVEFTEPIDCASLDASDFEIIFSSTGESVEIDSMIADCSFNNQVQSIQLILSETLPDLPTDFQISYVEENGLILDLCGNPVPVDTSYQFTTDQWITVSSIVTPTVCFEEVGSVNIANVNGEVGPITYLFDGEPVLSPLVEELGVGTYLVEVTDSLGCHISEEVEVESDILEIEVIMPNVFSPNDDDLNDLLGPIGIDNSTGEEIGLVDAEQQFGSYSLQIFNRWGKQVFTGTLGRPFWNGKDGTDDLAEGTYFYILQYERSCSLVDEGQQELTGTFTLVR